MHQIELTNLDLNLLVTLDVLLDARSVTAAAARLGRTQSATSHALARLRDSFDDPLLVRRGNRMVPTPRAEQLQAPLAEVLSQLVRLVRAGPGFDPSSARRRFRIAAPDLLAPLIPGLMAAMAEAGPGIDLELVAPLRGASYDRLIEGGVDLAIEQAPREGAGLVIRGLGAVNLAVAARSGHPFMNQPSAASWCRWPHALVSSGDASVGFVGQLARAAGLERRVGLRVPTFLIAAHVVAQTSLLFSAPRELLAPLTHSLGLELAPLPLDHAPIPVAAIWHERVSADPAHQWFRALAVDTIRASLRGCS